MRARVFIGLLPLLAPFLAAGAAVAQPAQPLDRLLPEIRRNVPGQFLDAESATQGGNPRYHLKWLTPDGRVMWLDADARTGRVLNRAPGRDSFDAPPPRGDENGGPPDRGSEGRGYQQYDRQYQRYDAQGDRAEGRRQFRPADNGDEDRAPPQRNFDNGGERGQGGFGRFERGGDRGFGGRPDVGNRGDRGGFGNRNFGGGRSRGDQR